MALSQMQFHPQTGKLEKVILNDASREEAPLRRAARRFNTVGQSYILFFPRLEMP